MRLCFVTPRYGADIVGGAETQVRAFAERLSRAGHDVRVLTTCARNHFTWANELPPGSDDIDGVRVSRFPVTVAKDHRLMARLQLLVDARLPLSPEAQRRWVTNTGFSAPLLDAVAEQADAADALCFAPYLFATTVFGAVVRPERSVIMPCLHDEAYARFDVIRSALAGAAGLIFNTDAERRLAERLLDRVPRHHTVGFGFDLPQPRPDRFRRRHGLSGDVVVYAGRREGGKNFPLLLEWVTAYNLHLSRNGPITLVVAGSGAYQLPAPARPWVRDVGFLSEEEKADALAASTAAVNLSVNESFSHVVLEAWACSVPAVVHRDCAVTREHCEASGGGLWVGGVEEFAEVIDRLRERAELRRRLGASGRRYVTTRYSWPAVLERMTSALADLVTTPGRRTGALAR